MYGPLENLMVFHQFSLKMHSVDAVYVDLERVFDSVIHSKLIFNLALLVSQETC